jgi:hypothetical protein
LGLETPSDLGRLLYTPAIDPLLSKLEGPRKDGGR